MLLYYIFLKEDKEMDLQVVTGIVKSKYTIANIMSVAGLGCDILAAKCLLKEYDEFKHCKQFGREYHPNMDNLRKLSNLITAGFGLAMASAVIKLDASNQLIKAQQDYINSLMKRINVAQEDYRSLFDAWCKSLNLCNDITEVASLHMNKEHFCKYEADLAKLSGKYAGVIKYCGLAPYDIIRDRAASTLNTI